MVINPLKDVMSGMALKFMSTEDQVKERCQTAVAIRARRRQHKLALRRPPGPSTGAWEPLNLTVKERKDAETCRQPMFVLERRLACLQETVGPGVNAFRLPKSALEADVRRRLARPHSALHPHGEEYVTPRLNYWGTWRPPPT